MTQYEYGIAHRSDVRDGKVLDVHRTLMTEAEAVQWLDEFEADGGREGAFVMIRRPINAWEVA